MPRYVGSRRRWRPTRPPQPEQPCPSCAALEVEAADLAAELDTARAMLHDAGLRVHDLTADRDAWREQAMRVADRYADAVEDVRKSSALTGGLGET